MDFGVYLRCVYTNIVAFLPLLSCYTLKYASLMNQIGISPQGAYTLVEG